MSLTSGATNIEAFEHEIQDICSAIKKARREVSKTSDEINDLVKDLQRIEAQLLSPSLSAEERAELLREEQQLRTAKQQLRTQKLQLRNEELKLRNEELHLRDQLLQVQQGQNVYLKRACIMPSPSKTSLRREQLDPGGPLINNWRPTAVTAGGQLPELIHPVFARVSDFLAGSTRVDQESITAAAKLCCIGAEIYDEEETLTKAVQDLLGLYLAGIPAVPVSSGFADLAIPDWALCDSSTDPTNLFLVVEAKLGNGGSEDLHFQGANYHVHFWQQRTDGLMFKKTCCPAFLLEVIGPHLRLSAMAWVDRVTVFPLTPLLNLLAAHPDTDRLLMPVARLLAALREGVRELAEIYAAPAALQQPAVPKELGLPWPIRMGDRYDAMSARRLAGRNPTYYVRLRAAGSSGEGGGASGAAGTASAGSARGTGGAAGTASTGVSEVVQVGVVVKLCRKYGLEAHMAWADIGLAPQVLRSEQQPGGWLLVEMEWLPWPDWHQLSDLLEEDFDEALQAVKEALVQAHTTTGMVHGDMRPPNCLVRRGPVGAGSWQVRFVDFKWAGREGEATYPAFLNPDIPWPMGVDYGQKLQAVHDLQLLAAASTMHREAGKRRWSEVLE